MLISTTIASPLALQATPAPAPHAGHGHEMTPRPASASAEVRGPCSGRGYRAPAARQADWSDRAGGRRNASRIARHGRGRSKTSLSGLGLRSLGAVNIQQVQLNDNWRVSMKQILFALAATALFSTPANAQSAAEGQPSQADKPAPKPQACEMMHGTTKMRGVMVKGKDGKMVCQMTDHGATDHGQIDHSQMDHHDMKHSPTTKDAHAGHRPK